MTGPARRMWTLFEPVHAVTYFAPEALEAYKAAGLRGFWRGTRGPGRAAGGGRAGGGDRVVLQLRARLRGPGAAVGVGADLAKRSTGSPAGGGGGRAGRAAGRAGQRGQDGGGPARAGPGRAGLPGLPLAAANGALAPATNDLERLWQAATTLREHRGDGHFAAVLAADLDGAEVLVLRCGLDMSRETMQPIRGWTDEQWDAAAGRLAGRGLPGRRRGHHRGGPGREGHGGRNHRPGRRAAVGEPRGRSCGRTRGGADAAGPGLRRGRPLSEPDWRAGAGEMTFDI